MEDPDRSRHALSWPASVLAKTLCGLSRKFTVTEGCVCFCDTMCLDIWRHKKKVLPLLLLMAIGSIIYYLYTLKLEGERDESATSTTSRLERDIRDLQAVFESEVIPDLGALGRPARGNWTEEQLEAIAKSQRETGYNAWLSKRISPERSLYDMRHRR